MSAISWAGVEAFSSPASTSTASSGDNWLNSFMSSFALGLQPSFAWPGSGGGSLASAGESAFGNARTARASTSATTGGFANGFLLLNTNRVSLHHIGSTWTGLLAHSAMVDHGGGVGNAPFTARWLTQSGSTTTSSVAFGTFTFTFPVPYGAPPFVQISTTSGTPLSPNYAVNLSSVTTAGFSAAFSGYGAGPLVTGFTWESDGTVPR